MGLRSERRPDQQHPARTAATAGFPSIPTVRGSTTRPRRRSSATSATRRRSTTTAAPIRAASASPAPSRARRPTARANANLPQNNPAGGCIIDVRQAVSQIQPEQDNGSFFGRFTKQITPRSRASSSSAAAYAKTSVDGLPIAPSAAYFTPDGVVHSQPRLRALGAAHPDNPYFGTAARLSYLPLYDTGPTADQFQEPHRALRRRPARARWQTWDFDTGVVYSSARQQRRLDQDAQLARQQCAAESDRGQRRRRDRLQPGLRRAARRHVSGASAKTPA